MTLVRTRNLPPRVHPELFNDVGIDAQADPWVWITTDGPVTPDRAVFRLDDGGERRSFPLTAAERKAWSGYSLVALAVELTDDDPVCEGLWETWDDLSLDVRYVHIGDEGSPLYVEYRSNLPNPGLSLGGLEWGHSAPQQKRALAALALVLVLHRSRRGRPSNSSKRHPVKVELARRAWEIHQREPLVSWDQIAARLLTTYTGRTLRLWCERDGLHER